MTTDPFEHDDAAYVLGMVAEPDREAFEADLTTCDACTTRVNTLAIAPTLFADITAAELAEPDTTPDSTPDTLLPGLPHRAAAARRPVALIVRLTAAATAERSFSAREVP
jgi:anti-sigma factor RsiW